MKITLLNTASFINGIFFYNIEYCNYLLDQGFDCKLIMPYYKKEEIEFYLNDKYNLKKFNKNFFKNFSTNHLDLYKINSHILILNQDTFKKLKNILTVYSRKYKIFYNYYNDLSSLKISFKGKYKKYKFNFDNIITFGDKDVGFIEENHYPLCIYFKIFKKIKSFKNKILKDYKNKKIHTRVRNIKNFHQSFNVYEYIDDNFFDRANRNIVESKFYNKKIIYKEKDYIDSTMFRYKRDWSYYDLEKYKFKNQTFAEFLKNNIKGEYYV